MTRPMRKAFFSQPAAAKLYVDDVFSAYTYTGNGSSQAINNGIDLAGKGGLVWIKSRTNTSGGATAHALVDTIRGQSSWLSTDNSSSAATNANIVNGFYGNGFGVGSAPYWANELGIPYVSWSFRKAPKFFDAVTWTGDGSASKTIAHSLGSAPGFVIVKGVSAATDWTVFHRMLNSGINPEQHYLRLNGASAQSNAVSNWGNTPPNASNFYVSGNSNANGVNYIAYLFSHDPSADGLIQCGTCTAGVVNLGWEPQYLLIKRMDSTGDWIIRDSMREMPASGSAKNLLANTSGAESDGGSFTPTATGFDCSGVGPGTYIYMAIRRPNKPPTSGTQVYNAIARTGNISAVTTNGVGFPPDFIQSRRRNGAAAMRWYDRLRGRVNALTSSDTGAEFPDSTNGPTSINMDGLTIPGDTVLNSQGNTFIDYYFKRAPGFFDEVCSSGFNPGTPINHSLKVAPEIVIVKIRNDASAKWMGAINDGGNIRNLSLNTNGAGYLLGASWATYFSSTTIDPAGIRTDTGGSTTGSSMNAVAYLFATLPGISKVGSYAGNGASQTINCGFATGARFILIKRTDAAGDWYVWDSVRGIVAANDPHLSLNTTAAEVTTDDSVDPEASGFIVNQVAATNINVSGASYIFLAIA